MKAKNLEVLAAMEALQFAAANNSVNLILEGGARGVIKQLAKKMKTAHTWAKFARSLVDEEVWMEVAPHF
ncbi:unnamed protein product [Ilex paraguariensis]|uniref:Uncharacterized protein n=1 Tax=Ilex paraguariensis TaxID=185542 RepID=A0ABC8TM72_9AQUA